MVWHQALCYGYGYRTVENIARYHISAVSHLKAGGAPGFAYTMAVDTDGTVYLANGVDVATWSHGCHCGHHNGDHAWQCFLHYLDGF
jgi:hypothetical protein